MGMDMIHRRRFLALILASAAATACGTNNANTTTDDGPSTVPGSDPSPVEPASLEQIQHSFKRATPTTDGLSAVAGDQQLASNLFQLLADTDDNNFIFSPYSIATAFSMLLAGANGQTANQIADALGATDIDTDWHQARNGLDRTVRTPAPQAEGSEPLQLEIANAPFGQNGFEFNTDYIQLLAEQYGADLQSLNFAADPEGARLAINQWVAEQTDDRINDLLPENSITDAVRLVLVNTVFFKATWFTEFDPTRTVDTDFTLLDGTMTRVPTMNGSVRTTYVKAPNYEMVRLPYWGGYSMMIIVPNPGKLEDVESQISGGLLQELTTTRNDHNVTISLPKFDFKTKTDLIPLFKTLGVVDAFDSRADLSGIVPKEIAELYVSGAFHQATIEVDEIGTTATAATAIVVEVASAPAPAALTIDRPFLFTIQQDQTGEPLFIGRVTNPNT